MRKLPLLLAAVAALLPGATPLSAQERGPLNVLTTTTDLRELAREVGGDDVAVTCLTRGPEDPHFVEARPSFVKAASVADALIVTGLELEAGYESLLLGDSRNARIQKGRAGHIDASRGVRTLEVPQGPVDRSHGDVHPYGNPHYLLDPARAKQAAATIAEAFAAIDPDRADAYRKRLLDFVRRVDAAMWGEALCEAQPPERLERRLADGTLLEFLAQRGLSGKLGGLAAELAPFAGREVVPYHGNFRYLLDRFGIEELDRLEPRPGIPPSPRHLASVIRRMRDGGTKLVLRTPYQSEQAAASAADATGGVVVTLAHMPDALPGTSSYLDLLRENVARLARAFRASGASSK